MLGEATPEGGSALPTVARIEAFLAVDGECVADTPPVSDDKPTNDPDDAVYAIVAFPERGAHPHTPLCESQASEDDIEERAAILEFDAGYTRKAAEKLARSNGSWRVLRSDGKHEDDGGREGLLKSGGSASNASGPFIGRSVRVPPPLPRKQTNGGYACRGGVSKQQEIKGLQPRMTLINGSRMTRASEAELTAQLAATDKWHKSSSYGFNCKMCRVSSKEQQQ